MIVEFLVAGEWCTPDLAHPENAPALVMRRDNYWRDLHWQGLGRLIVKHPEHGGIWIVPSYFPWRYVG